MYRPGAIGPSQTGTNVTLSGPASEPGVGGLPGGEPAAGRPRRNRCGPVRAPEPPPAGPVPRGRSDPPRRPEAPPDAPSGRARDGASARGGGGLRHRKRLGPSAAAVARRAAAAALLLLAATLGAPASAQGLIPSFELKLDRIAGNDTVNIAEWAAGFTISGSTGSESNVSVTVWWGTKELAATTSLLGGGWGLRVPAHAAYIVEGEITLAVHATKAGFGSPIRTRTVTVDLTAPSVSYAPPATLTAKVPIADMIPSGSSDINRYIATGLPLYLRIDRTTGVISGYPRRPNPSTTIGTVTVYDTAGNAAEVSIIFPAVAFSRAVELNIDPIAGDDMVNIAEHAAESEFVISGDTGSEVAGVSLRLDLSPTLT